MSFCFGSRFCCAEYHQAECRYAESRFAKVVMLNVITLNAVMLSFLAIFKQFVPLKMKGRSTISQLDILSVHKKSLSGLRDGALSQVKL